jgi:hypothetical protein
VSHNNRSGDRIRRDVRTAVDEESRLQLQRWDEQAFVGFTSGTVTSGGGTRTLHLKNPTGTGTNIDVVRFIASPQFTGTFAIYDVFSSDPSGGSTVEIDNLLMDSANTQPDEGQMEMNENVDFTASGTHLELPLPGGGTGVWQSATRWRGRNRLSNPVEKSSVRSRTTTPKTRPVG